MKQQYDIVVSGGGMVGAAFACLISGTVGKSDLNVAVVDAQRPPVWSPKAELGLRVSAISRASQNVLDACGAWSAIASGRISPFREMWVWDTEGRPDSSASIHFEAATLGEPDLGHIVENDLIRFSLGRRLEQLGSVDLIAPARLVGAETEAGHLELELDNGTAVETSLLVVADGVNSATRRILEIPTRGWGYGQKAVVSHLRTELHHNETAWQRFLPGGPLALLPLADGRCSMVWSASADDADALVDLPEDVFDRRVTEASAGILGRVLHSGPRGAFPLQLLHALEYTRPRVALIGDAAHGVHPLAGQGANLGFLDAASLAQCVGDGLTSGMDPGDHTVLRRYARWRKGENLLMMGALDGLQRLFASSNPLLATARRAGLTLADRLTPLKQRFIRRAMGLDGDLPRLARPDSRMRVSP